ncbi:VSP [Giardia lamblia P15]|uniref:VSP n=1 Tax=Giardia intestinalis (strain P15) TaxID=658858 RepID=E1F6M3_GIAIA|nr:VSP [Giardia lamblia P15]
MLCVGVTLAVALGMACSPGGDYAVTCANDKCELVDGMEVCTECKAGGVPIDGFCWPVGSPQIITAGCTKEDGADLDDTATTCGTCSGAGHFLFMGGCYNQNTWMGRRICSETSGGECTACARADWLFENPAKSPAPGTKCILCSDANGDGKARGVENCVTCQTPGSSPGVATCGICRVGYANRGDACVQCGDGCSACSADTPTQCTACFDGKYLSTDKCVDATKCEANHYADKKTWSCKACSDIEGCTECTYNDATGKPKCTNCNGKLIRTAADGTTTCVDANQCAQNDQAGTHFLTKNSDMCLLCNDVSIEGEAANKGVEGCGTCKKADPSQNVVCTACMDGYYDSDDGPDTATCVACGENCATCVKDTKDQCTTCRPGFFLKAGAPNECVSCDDTTNGGSEGCSACSNDGEFKCTDCKANYRTEGTSDNYICRKTCEDETACGGTAGTCGTIVIQENGDFLHHCSLCGDPNTFPIDGICVKEKSGNTCANGVCTQCAAGYFLYMGGCYSAASAPGNTMCKEAPNGVCIAPSENNKYFLVPEAKNNQQSIMLCENPIGIAVDEKVYVGVEGCDTCTAPAPLTEAGMRPARCTACNSGRKPNLAGSGCFLCTVGGCSHCSANGVCEACTSEEQRPNTAGTQCISCNINGCTRCSEENKCDQCGDGYRLEGETCVQIQPSACQTLGNAGCATCDPNGGDEICLTCTKESDFLQLNKKSCKASCDGDGEIADPTSTPKVCKCDAEKGYQLQGDACVQIQPNPCQTENCQECTNRGKENEVCTECISTHYLTPTSQCVPDCTVISGYYGDADKKCKRCHDACAECVGTANNQCSACSAGRALTYADDNHPDNGGTCGDACTANENGCKACGAKIGGTDYCSKCSADSQAPLNGVCTANARAQFCTQVTEGSCTSCNDGYFLRDGGCYETTKQPGKQVCTQANGGQCQTCANGLETQDGDCSKSACHPTCATCTAASQADKCSTCLAGYYLDVSRACTPCTETSGAIQGVAGCASCTAPSGNQGPVLCYLLKGGDSTGGSTNRSGLSTGAIAGIAVAAVIVAGGLVGFLCWWFLCRGRA